MSYLPTRSPSSPPLSYLPLLLQLALLLATVLCFLVIHPLPFISHCSAPPCVSNLFLSRLSIFAHLPSHNPFRLWLLCKFPHFLPLCLIPPFSFSLSFFLSVLSALEATWVRQCYQSQLYLATFSPPFLPPLPVSFCLVSIRLLTLLPSMSPCFSCSYFESHTHTHTHTHTHPQIIHARHMVPHSAHRDTPSLFPSFLASSIRLNFSPIFPPHLLHLSIFPMPPFFSLTASSSQLWHLSPTTPESPSPLHLLLLLY